LSGLSKYYAMHVGAVMIAYDQYPSHNFITEKLHVWRLPVRCKQLWEYLLFTACMLRRTSFLILTHSDSTSYTTWPHNEGI